jgi:ABC-type branched-subunit amino acid transport system substrate-binding protein
VEPLQRWYLEKAEFRGPGRDDPDPEGLASVKIGVLAPLAGSPDESLGASMLEGMRLALDEANAGGGYRGIPFEAVVRNDLPLWGASSNAVVDLCYRERVWALLGSVEGNSTHVLLRVALKIEVPVVNTADTDPTLTETNIPWLVRVIPDDRQSSYRLFRRCFHELGLRRVALLRFGDRFGRVHATEFADSMRRAGAPVVADLRWRPGGVPEPGTAEKLRALRADGVVLWGNGDDMGRVARALRREGVALPIFGPDRMVSEAFVREAGEAAEGATAAFPFDPGRADPAWTAFVARFAGRHGRAPDAYAAHGYDGARLLVESIRRAGLNRARIRDALYAPDRWDGGVTGPILFDAARNNLRPARLAVRRGGAWVHGE